MARSEVNLLVTARALRLIEAHRGSELLDLPGVADAAGTRNVCAKVSPALADQIDAIAGLLGISKRRLLEAAFVDLVAEAHAIFRAEGVPEECGTSEPPIYFELSSGGER